VDLLVVVVEVAAMVVSFDADVVDGFADLGGGFGFRVRDGRKTGFDNGTDLSSGRFRFQ
jgi:hypothetical protein